MWKREWTGGKFSHLLRQPRAPLLLAHVLVRLPGVLELRVRALDLGLQRGFVLLLPVHARGQVPGMCTSTSGVLNT